MNKDDFDTTEIEPLKSRDAWELEYQNQELISDEDVATIDSRNFLKWYFKEYKKEQFSNFNLLDLGCGLGKTLRFAKENYDISALGVDISFNAINMANNISQKKSLEIDFRQADILEDSFWQGIEKENFDVVILGTIFHLFDKKEQENILSRINNILTKTKGVLYLRTFILDGDKNAKNLIKLYKGKQENSYLHPGLGVLEYMSELKDLRKLIIDKQGKIIFEKIDFSYQKWHNQSYKRKSVIMYISYGQSE